MTFIKQHLSPWSNLSQYFVIVVVVLFFLFIDKSPILGLVCAYFCESVTEFILALKDQNNVPYHYPVEKSSDF